MRVPVLAEETWRFQEVDGSHKELEKE